MCCLILILVFAQCVSATVLFYPNTSIVNLCVGDDFTLTCVTDTGTLTWRVGDLTKTYSKALPVNQPNSLGDHIIVYPINVSSSVITSVANITGAPLALNGTVIQCRNNLGDSKEKILFVSGGALPITDLRFTALSFTAVSIEWKAAQRQCDNGFHIRLVSSLSMNVLNTTSLTTSVNVTGLSRAVEYNITVTVVSDGNEVTANLLMTLDVPKQVAEVTVISRSSNSMSTRTITIIWQQPPSSSRPPVMYYTVQHNVSTDTDDGISQVNTTMTNITIDGAQPGHVYYIEVTAVNILGPGPPTSTFVHEEAHDAPSVMTCECVTKSDSGLLAASVIPWMLLSVVCTANAIYIAYRCYNLRRDKKCEGVVVAAGECVPEENHGVIYDQPDQTRRGGEQFAMNKNMSYSAVQHNKTETD